LYVFGILFARGEGGNDAPWRGVEPSRRRLECYFCTQRCISNSIRDVAAHVGIVSFSSDRWCEGSSGRLGDATAKARRRTQVPARQRSDVSFNLLLHYPQKGACSTSVIHVAIALLICGTAGSSQQRRNATSIDPVLTKRAPAQTECAKGTRTPFRLSRP